MVRTLGKAPHGSLTNHAGNLILNFPGSRTVRNFCCLKATQVSVFCSVLPNGRPVPIREHEDSNFPRSWPTLTSLADVKSELIVALICLSQMVEDAEHFLMSCCPLSPSSVDYNFTLLTVSFNAWSIHTLIMSMYPLLLLPLCFQCST